MNWLLFFCYQSGLQWSPGPRFTDLPAGQTGTTNMLRRQDTKLGTHTFNGTKDFGAHKQSLRSLCAYMK